MLNGRRRYQTGVTMVELLIGIAVGILVVSGATVMYVSSIKSAKDTLRGSKLNQEVGALMSVIVNDVRRAGFWTNPGTANYDQNPFSQTNTTVLTVIDDMGSNTPQGPTGQGTCLVYAYDATYLPANIPGTLETTDLFGFRLNGTTVQMRQTGDLAAPNSCANGTWVNVTDPDLIEITQLDFDLSNSQCLNASEPNGEDDDADGTIDETEEMDCYAVVPPNASNESTAETREVLVSITGRLAADTSTQMTATQTIRVRNDHLRIR